MRIFQSWFVGYIKRTINTLGLWGLWGPVSCDEARVLFMISKLRHDMNECNAQSHSLIVHRPNRTVSLSYPPILHLHNRKHAANLKLKLNNHPGVRVDGTLQIVRKYI